MSNLKKFIKSGNKLFCRIGFAFARHLPATYCKWFPWGGPIRRFFARGFIVCGKDVNIQYGSHFGCDVVLGDHSDIGAKAWIVGPLIIGKYVMMGPDAVILAINHEFSDTSIPMMYQGHKPPKTIVIEDDVWIGQRCTILSGVRIGKGSIIGAGAVVAKDIPPYSIAVGNPARVIKSRLAAGIEKEKE